MNTAIRLADVSWRRAGDFSLRDVSLSVPTGAVYGLVGANGSGKTSLIRLIMGLDRADDGVVEVLGHRLPAEGPEARRTVGFVPERLHLYRDLTVGGAMSYHAAFHERWDDTFATQLLQSFGLRVGQRVGEMSKGESGRLMLLLALATRPTLLVLDEPTDGLDPVARRDVLGMAMAYVAESRATVLITSHLIHEIERICDWVGLLDDGRIVSEQPMMALKDSLRRLQVQDPPPPGAMPFTVVSRTAGLGRQTETWIVDQIDRALPWLQERGATVSEVGPLDLEDTVVELLRSFRAPTRQTEAA